jgi:hypothetical protein
VVSAFRIFAAVAQVLFIQTITWQAPLLAAESPKRNGLATHSRAFGSGRLVGVVTDSVGEPAEATLVSATGPAGVSLAVCDVNGRFEFVDLHPGTYLLRTHASGLDATRRFVVQVRPGLSTAYSVALPPRKVFASSPPTFIAAGFGATDGQLKAPDDFGVAGVPDEVLPGSGVEVGPTATGSPVPHDDSEKAWRLRRTRRSVLKDSGIGISPAHAGDGESLIAIAPRLAADRTMSGAPSTFPVSGRLHLLTRATVDSPADFQRTDVLPGQIAYAEVGGAESDTRWGLRGAMMTGDAGSWVLSGTYNVKPAETHAMTVGLSYSRQHIHSRVNQESLIPSAAVIEDAVTPDFSREVGAMNVRGTWKPSRRVTLDYGTSLARYGYLPGVGLASPNAVVTVEPLNRTRVQVTAAQNMRAPGAEEFLPPANELWLPAERTFTLLSPTNSLFAERSRHFEVAVERDFWHGSTVGARRYYQEVNDQMVALFGIRPEIPVSSAAHYHVISAGGVNTDGWGLMFSHALASRVRGTVDYSLTNATWGPWTASGLPPQAVGVFRTGTEKIHDVTTSIEAEIPETATEFFVLYRVNSAFSVVDSSTAALASGLDGRFALRVKQALPFSPVSGSDWEVLVDIRSLFREDVLGASVYDELLVASPPKQFIGGLVVHF